MKRPLALAGALSLLLISVLCASHSILRFSAADEYVVVQQETWAVSERLACHPFHAPRATDVRIVQEGSVLAVVRSDDRHSHLCHQVWLPDGQRGWVLDAATRPAEWAAHQAD